MYQVILVDENDSEIGVDQKLKVHKEGRLHRAFSIFLFNSKKELLIQQRAKSKYHSGGLWSNTCCSHADIKDPIKNTASKRLEEETGLKAGLKEIFSFQYQTPVSNDMIENEIDHVFVGFSENNSKPNHSEVESLRWISLNDLKNEIKQFPERFTPWLKIILEKYSDKLEAEIK
jgi:isopentenyl-diphosphate delta-isomerase